MNTSDSWLVIFLQMKPISEEELQQMELWYNKTKLRQPDSAGEMDLLQGDVRLGQNFTFDDFVKVRKIFYFCLIVLQGIFLYNTFRCNRYM